MFKFFSIKKLSLGFLILLVVSLQFIFVLPKTFAQVANSNQTSQAEDGTYYRPNLFIPGMDRFFTEFRIKEDPVTELEYKEYKIDGASLAKYIKAVYIYAGIIAGAFAMFMLVYGAWQWLMAAGNASKITMAKETVSTTLIGLAFLFGGYLLLSQISTRLVNLQPLQVNKVVISERCAIFKEQVACERNNCLWQAIAAQSADQPASGTCIAPPIIGCEQSCPIESSLQSIVINDPRFGTNGVSDPRLTPATLDALRRVVSSLSSNERIVLNSAFRSCAKQKELYDCYMEKQRTGGCSCSSCNEAAAPSCEAPHQTGRAVDVCYQDNSSGTAINTCAGYVYERFNCLDRTTDPCTPRLSEAQNRLKQLMVAAGFSPYAGEWWHFEYSGS